MRTEARKLLEAVQSGEVSVDDALVRLKSAPFEDIGFAKVDLHRSLRQGAAEVIYGAGKTPEQIAGIIRRMRENGQDRILVTRLSGESARTISQ
ncbi:MAG: 1-(5-phosphoribosyl)-5-amino-4-imidazole-carboxylate carboxylase, partial [Ruminiclostridium sp.]|nr:1-(5-phosphoribosyl)-5-amino-4-imidazole-carboxylate carboxylase [Ruminiclostridium sp.]